MHSKTFIAKLVSAEYFKTEIYKNKTKIKTEKYKLSIPTTGQIRLLSQFFFCQLLDNKLKKLNSSQVHEFLFCEIWFEIAFTENKPRQSSHRQFI